jgi:transcriptional regulator with XRE-family HTH domain
VPIILFWLIYQFMGFKENLKSELIYTGMLVKELSAQTGISKHTLDNYLNTHNALPNAEGAVKIARALGVTVEYLVTGQEKRRERTLASLPPDMRLLVDIAEKLSSKNRRLAIKLVKVLQEEGGGTRGMGE